MGARKGANFIRRICNFFAVSLLFAGIGPTQAFGEPTSNAERAPNYGRGPIQISDPFPLGQLAPSITADSPEVLRPGSAQIGSQFAWSNTLNKRGDSFTVDSETRVLATSFQYGLTPDLQAGVRVPVVWRGAGSLDNLIYDWHDFFGLPQGPRDDAGAVEDRYRIRGKTESGDPFELDETGTALGNIALTTKYQLSPGDDSRPAAALIGELTLPTAADEYGLEGIGLNLGGVLAKRYSRLIFYTGANYVFTSDSEVSNISYDHHRAAGFLSAELEFEIISLHLGAQIASRLVDDISRFPNYEFYVDSGVTVPLGSRASLEAAVRENPAPSRGTADFTAIAGLKLLLF